MKSILTRIFPLLGVCVLSVSCNRDDLPTAGEGGTLCPVAIRVTPSAGMTTRADANDPEAEYCYVQVLDADGTLLPDDESAVHAMTKGSDGAFGVDIMLIPDKEYDFLFWADNVSETAPADLTAVDYPADGATIAFAAKLDDWEWKPEGVETALRHVVTRVSVESTGAAPIEERYNLTVSVPRCYTAFDVAAMAPVAGSETDGFSFSDFSQVSHGGGHMGHFYVLGDAEATAQETLTILYTTPQTNPPLEIPNVPMKPDYHITLQGDVAEIGLTDVDFTVAIDETWGDSSTSALQGYFYDEATNTYTVFNEEGLKVWAEAAQEDLTTNCILGDDIVLTPPAGSDGSNWTPIGPDRDNPYTGTFDGDGHSISGLVIYLPDKDYVGLFGCIVSINGLKMNQPQITGRSYIGSVAGYVIDDCTDCSAENVSVTGTGANSRRIGGVAGYIDRDCSGCKLLGDNNTVSGDSDVGGVAGDVDGDCTGCSAENVSVTGTGANSRRIGGVFGNMDDDSKMTDCTATNVSVSGNSDVGGVVGNASEDSEMTNCTATNVSVSGYSEVGGVVGDIGDEGDCISCKLLGDNNTVSGHSYVGGVAGDADNCTYCTAENVSVIGGTGEYSENIGGVVGDAEYCSDCSATNVSVSGYSDVGGVAGDAEDCTDCTAENVSVTATDEDSKYVGGVVGDASSCSDCSATNVSVSGYSDVGGVVGNASNSCSNCKLLGDNNTVSGHSDVGGVAGYTSSSCSDCTAENVSVTATGEDSNHVGGVVGMASSCSDCTATNVSVTVTGEDSENVGGIVGHTGSDCTDCKLLGDNNTVSGHSEVGGVVGDAIDSCTGCSAEHVSVSGYSSVGGVAGETDGCYGCYATGSVSGNSYVGGIAGENNYNIIGCYSTCTVSGNSSVGGILGGYAETVTASFWSGYEGPGIGDSNDGGATKVDGTTVTWTSACSAMNDAIEAWNLEHPYDKVRTFYENPDYDPADPASAPLLLEETEE